MFPRVYEPWHRALIQGRLSLPVPLCSYSDLEIGRGGTGTVTGTVKSTLTSGSDQNRDPVSLLHMSSALTSSLCHLLTQMRFLAPSIYHVLRLNLLSHRSLDPSLVLPKWLACRPFCCDTARALHLITWQLNATRCYLFPTRPAPMPGSPPYLAGWVAYHIFGIILVRISSCIFFQTIAGGPLSVPPQSCIGKKRIATSPSGSTSSPRLCVLTSSYRPRTKNLDCSKQSTDHPLVLLAYACTFSISCRLVS